jgi:hypothetical protein
MTTPQPHSHTSPGDGGRLDYSSENPTTLPHCSVRRTSSAGNQSVSTSGANITVDFDTIETESGITFDKSSNQMTVPADGMYLITASAEFLSPTDQTSLRAFVLVNGSTRVADDDSGSSGGVNECRQPAKLVKLSANDTIELKVDSTNDETISGDEGDTFMDAVMVTQTG